MYIYANSEYWSEHSFKPDKRSFILVSVGNELQTDLVYRNETLKNSKQEKVLGVTIDNKLKL